MNTLRRFLTTALVAALLSVTLPACAQAPGAAGIPGAVQASLQDQTEPGSQDAGTAPTTLDEQTVARIFRTPGRYLNAEVEVEGTIDRLLEREVRSDEVQPARFYALKGDLGDVVYVRTSRDTPRINYRYYVKGVMTYAPIPGLFTRPVYFISEDARRQLNLERLEENRVEQTVGPESPETIVRDLNLPDPPREGPNPLMIALIVLAGLVLVGLGVTLVRTMRPKPALSTGTTTVLASAGGGTPVSMPAVSSGTPIGLAAAPATMRDGGYNGEPEIVEGKTIKLHRPSDDQTVKVLPGRFKVVGGLDDVPEIRFFMPRGRQTAEITFGRANGRPYEHIQLKPRTVSSRQAKLVFDGGQYTLVNHASRESNPTQVNGRDLNEGESVRLNPGDRIAMGEVEFEYAAG